MDVKAARAEMAALETRLQSEITAAWFAIVAQHNAAMDQKIEAAARAAEQVARRAGLTGSITVRAVKERTRASGPGVTTYAYVRL
jgi:hypothetical protein